MDDISVRDFLTSREAVLKEKKAAISAELAEIRILKSTLGDSGKPAASRSKSSEPTIKEMILDVLSDREDGATSDEIIALVMKKYDKVVPRSSMSPQLSRLKGDDQVARENERWMLPKFAPGNSDGVSSPDTDPVAHNVGTDRHQTQLPVGIPPSEAMPAPATTGERNQTITQGGPQLMPRHST